MALTFHLVDVFGTAPFSGNPVAVVSGAEGLSTEQMQRITRWFNLSETTFLLPPGDEAADYRVRIFTLERELPFAGHPTLGTCHVWLETEGSEHRPDVVVQECGAGLVTLWRGEEGLAFAAPPLMRYEPPSADELAEALAFLGLDAAEVLDASWVDNGPGWLALRLPSADSVLALEPPRSWPRRIDVGVVGPHPQGAGVDFEVRALFTDHLGAILEDPATGSLNASIGQWFYDSGVVEGAYTARQGTRLGRDAAIAVTRDAEGRVWVGGSTRTHVSGELSL